MSRDELRETFFQECEDLLEVLGSGLMMMEDGTNDEETINAIFRAVHSIKGGAAAFGLDELVTFAHTFETALDQVRSGALELSRDVLDCLPAGFGQSLGLGGRRAGRHVGGQRCREPRAGGDQGVSR